MTHGTNAGACHCDLAGLRPYHNPVRPHLGLDGRMPGEAAGIRIEDGNKRKTRIQAATKAEAAA